MESSKKSQLILTIALSFVCMSMSAQSQAGTATITFQEQKAETTISRHIYGHFSEHLGHCIYDGLWVGKDSEIPNIDGVRKDVFDALKQIRIPNFDGLRAEHRVCHHKTGLGDEHLRPRKEGCDGGR